MHHPNSTSSAYISEHPLPNCGLLRIECTICTIFVYSNTLPKNIKARIHATQLRQIKQFGWRRPWIRSIQTTVVWWFVWRFSVDGLKFFFALYLHTTILFLCKRLDGEKGWLGWRAVELFAIHFRSGHNGFLAGHGFRCWRRRSKLVTVCCQWMWWGLYVNVLQKYVEEFSHLIKY